ncbi:MAG: TMEM165/GDT1 family protein [Mycobacteriaceae bacterium]|nr:TMEM165/GDT1 family protein [Mycobacteriaceae bacterium]
MSGAALFIAVFLACAVEAVEAATVVLAMGTARHWRSALYGVAVALLLLAAVTAVVGPAISAVPLRVLRLVVGAALLVFGLQWLRKAILRAGGAKALHDEDAVYRQQLAAVSAARGGRTDWYAFTVAFKSVVLEGLEVVFIVVTFGANQHAIPTAAGAALAAVVVIAGAAVAVRSPLSRVPENTIKFVVGVLLCSFGTYWGAEGAGATWPGSDAALLALLGFYAAVGLLLTRALRARTKLSGRALRARTKETA